MNRKNMEIESSIKYAPAAGRKYKTIHNIPLQYTVSGLVEHEIQIEL